MREGLEGVGISDGSVTTRVHAKLELNALVARRVDVGEFKPSLNIGIECVEIFI